MRSHARRLQLLPGHALTRPLLLALLLGSTACGARSGPGAETPAAAVTTKAPVLSAEDFAKTAHIVLSSQDQSDATKLQLASVVQYQLRRAEALYAQGYTEAAESVTSGALLLLRQDDAIASALQGRDLALLGSAHAAARRGNAGRAEALYRLTLQTTKNPATRKQIEDHLTALSQFSAATTASSPLIQAGDHARDKLAAAWVDPTSTARRTAQEAILDWMHEALGSELSENGPSSRMERDEALEAYRAVRSGAPALIALGLRHGDPLSAVRALDEAELSRALPPGIRLRLDAAGQAGSSEAYLDLFRLFEGLRRDGEEEAQLPPQVADGATLWTTIGLYRSSPGKLEHAMPLAMSLVEYGLPEVATSVLAQNLDPRTTPEALGWSLGLVLRGMIELSQTNQTKAAERCFIEAAPLLRLAEEPRYAGVRPEPARVYSLLASIEIRVGGLDRALTLLQQVATRTPSADTLIRLAGLHRQKGELNEAAAALEAALHLAQKVGNVLLEAYAEELSFQIERERGNTDEAKRALERALERTLTARAIDLSVLSTAAVERHLARILENYGNERATRRAYERALGVSRGNPAELEMTLTDMARSALTTGDVRLARLATRSALELGLSPDELIYIALWQKLTEQRARTGSDGLPAQVFQSAQGTTGWLAQLRLFALGQLDGAALLSVAQSIPEKAEAEFYRALTESGDADLGQVAKSTAIDLIEVKIAKDLLAPPQQLTIPSHLTIP